MNNIKYREEAKMPVTARGFLKTCGIIMVLLFVFGLFTEMKVSAATGTSVNVTIDYLDETATVKTGPGGSTKFYISTDNMKNWEVLDTSGVIDLSGILQTKSITVYFKGNKDTNPVGQLLQEAPNYLKVNYTIASGVGTLSCTTTGPAIQFRKGAYGDWKTATSSMSTSIYEIKGAVLTFRTVPSSGIRAGKIITVKIPKRPNAPSIKVEGSKLAVSGLKSQVTQYRVGDSSVWNLFLPSDTKSKTFDLSTLVRGTAANNTALPSATIEFRTLGSDKKLHSGVKIIEIPAQRTVPDTITVTGSTLTITDSDKTKSYEYTIVAKDSTLNLSTAKWKSASTKYSFVIPKVSVGDKVLVRLKSYTDRTSKQTVLASTYKEIPITTITTSK